MSSARFSTKHWHPAANFFPLLTGRSFDELAADIKRNGLLDPIVLFEGKVLDGRNRLRACETVGVKPEFVEWIPNGTGPFSWVVSHNLTRRHLTGTQRAVIGAKMLPFLVKEAKERQRLSRGRGHEGKKVLPNGNTFFGPAAEQAAEITGSSVSQIYRAKRIGDKSAEVLDRVMAKEISMAEAELELNIKKKLAAMQSSESMQWYTLQKYIDAVREVLGEIELDPASSQEANKIVKAQRIYTRKDNGLRKSFRSKTLFLNAPYGKDGPKFIPKLVQSYEAGAVGKAIAMVNDHSTATKWFKPLFNYLLCFTDHRPRFWKPDEQKDSPTHGAVFVYFGPNKDKFAEVFSRFGTVVQKYATRR